MVDTTLFVIFLLFILILVAGVILYIYIIEPGVAYINYTLEPVSNKIDRITWHIKDRTKKIPIHIQKNPLYRLLKFVINTSLHIAFLPFLLFIICPLLLLSSICAGIVILIYNKMK